MSAAGVSGPTVLQTSSSAASDIANVVEGISWNSCFTYLQWYRKDVRLTQPAQVTESNTIDQRETVSEIRAESDSSLSFTSSSSSCASSCSEDDCAKFEATLEPPRGAEDPEVHESTGGIFMPCSQPHGDAFSQAFVQQEYTMTPDGRRDWYEQRMALSFATVTTSEVVWLITYVSKAIAYLRSDVWLWGQGISRVQARQQCARSDRTASESKSYPAGMLRALHNVVRSSEDLRRMSDAARFVSCSINNKSKPWVDSGLHASMSPLYAHLSCRMLELASLMDEARAVAPEHLNEDVREANKDALSDNDASSAQDLDLADLYPTPYYFYLNSREASVPTPSHSRSRGTAEGVDASYAYTHPEI